MAVIEITLEQLQQDYDWTQVFADEYDGSVSKHVQEVPPGANVPNTSDGVSRFEVAEIIAAVNGENDGEDWVGVFLLKDGRYLRASGGCDYTGWDCQAGNSLCVAATLADIIKYGLTDKEKKRLGLYVSNN